MGIRDILEDTGLIDRRPTNELIRKLPEWAKIVRTVNGIDIYNLSILDNILSWTHDIPDVAAMNLHPHAVLSRVLWRFISIYCS